VRRRFAASGKTFEVGAVHQEGIEPSIISLWPSSYDLVENRRLVLMSVTEGEDKPLKYPTIFNSADVAVISKNELAAVVEFDWEAARKSILSVRPGMQIFRLSAKTGDGMEEFLPFLSRQPAEKRVVLHTQ
jgi:hydrogenase nickel incorporation protein HypB